MAWFARLNPGALLLVAGLLGLAACTELGYVKPGVTEEEYLQDSRECAEIARRQAFRDQAVFETRWRSAVSRRHDSRFWAFQDFGPTVPDLEFRYRRLCMLARGYELAPLAPDDEPPASENEPPASEEQPQ